MPASELKIVSMITLDHSNRIHFACPFHLILWWIFKIYVPSASTFRFEITGLLRCDFRYRHRRFEPREWPKISPLIVIDDIITLLTSFLLSGSPYGRFGIKIEGIWGIWFRLSPLLLVKIPMRAKSIFFSGRWFLLSYWAKAEVLLGQSKQFLFLINHFFSPITKDYRKRWCLVRIWLPCARLHTSI